MRRMIARLWRGWADNPANAAAYLRHLDASVLPALAKIEGHRGARVLQREADGRMEFIVMTLWDSMDAVRRFAGPHPKRALVEAQARAVLSEYDEFVRHYEVKR
jgi:heme-degrading monooxygenase HmoA